VGLVLYMLTVECRMQSCQMDFLLVKTVLTELRMVICLLITHIDSSHGVMLLPPFVCLSVFPHGISETDAARITKPDLGMFHAGNPFISG